MDKKLISSHLIYELIGNKNIDENSNVFSLNNDIFSNENNYNKKVIFDSFLSTFQNDLNYNLNNSNTYSNYSVDNSNSIDDFDVYLHNDSIDFSRSAIKYINEEKKDDYKLNIPLNFNDNLDSSSIDFSNLKIYENLKLRELDKFNDSFLKREENNKSIKKILIKTDFTYDFSSFLK